MFFISHTYHYDMTNYKLTLFDKYQCMGNLFLVAFIQIIRTMRVSNNFEDA